MKQLERLLSDRRRRQQGSILSGVLIIVAFLSILIGGLLTELTGSFSVSRDLVTRVSTEATVTSAVELGIHQLQAGPVPPVCTSDYSGGTQANRGPWSLTLNAHDATVTQTCTGIVPEVAQSLVAPDSFTVDGIHDTLAGRNRYLVTDNAGRLFSYPFGQTTLSWSVVLGGTPTASPLTATDPDGSVNIMVPIANSGAGCSGHCVAVFNERGGSVPTFSCNLASDATLNAPAAAEVTAGGSANFPGYAFFADSGRLFVYDASFGGTCGQLDSVALSGSVAGAPLVFPGSTSGNTVGDDIFLVVTGSGGTSFQHWRYTETTSEIEGEKTKTSGLSQVGSLALAGANAVGYGISSSIPTSGTPLTLAVATSGRLDEARISRSGSSYSVSLGPSMVLPNGAVTSRAPYWCHCPGQDLIGVGGTDGFLYLVNSGLTSTAYMYNSQADGFPAINTTPMADVNGDWYFGANDGSVYDVEVPVSGVQMFKAATFGPGGAITSSPIVGTCPGGLVGPCMYFASSSAGSYFVRIGSTRISDLRACVSTAAGSTSCAANPRSWARVQVGPGGVFVQGWSYYSP